MKTVFKGILIVLAVLIVVAVVTGVVLPSTYTVETETVISAPPGQIHSFVGDLEQWDAWTPWRQGDPSMEMHRGEHTTGVGASQSWQGAEGKGELEFTASSPDTGIEYRLLFDDQFPAVSAIRYEPAEEGTRVVWTMSGNVPTPVVGGYLALMIEKVTTAMFEDGLLRLKQVVESEPVMLESEERHEEVTMEADEAAPEAPAPE